MVSERRQAVVDLGSNSFRLVVFSWIEGSWWKRTDEIHEAVRIGEGLDAAGVLAPELAACVEPGADAYRLVDLVGALPPRLAPLARPREHDEAE